MTTLRCSIFFLAIIALFTSFRKPKHYLANADKDSYSVYVIKSEYLLKIYDADGEWMATYPVVFGSNDLGDKMMQGDRKTPEGTFHITAKRKHPKWGYFMSIDYPNQESVAKFNQRKAEGKIPYGAKIGGEIGIHGTWPNEDFAIDQYRNWTEGCVSTKNMYIKELFDLLPVGTRVEVRR
jgi:murein L,D-transpeptidase YafK